MRRQSEKGREGKEGKDEVEVRRLSASADSYILRLMSGDVQIIKPMFSWGGDVLR